MSDSGKLSSTSGRFSTSTGGFTVTSHYLDVLERQKLYDERMATISNPPEAPCPYERSIASLHPGPLRYDDAGLGFVMRPTAPPPSARNPRFARDWITALYGNATTRNPRLSARPTACVLFGSLDDCEPPKPMPLIEQTSNPLIRPRPGHKKVQHGRQVRPPDDRNKSAPRKKKDDAIDDIIRQSDGAQSHEEAEAEPRDDDNADAADDSQQAPEPDAAAPCDADSDHDAPGPPADDGDAIEDGEDDVRAALAEAADAFHDMGDQVDQAGEAREDEAPNERSAEEEEVANDDGEGGNTPDDVIGGALKEPEHDQETFDGSGDTLDDVIGGALKEPEHNQETFDEGDGTLDDVIGGALKEPEHDQETFDGTIADAIGGALKGPEEEEEPFDGGGDGLDDVMGRALNHDDGSGDALGDLIGTTLKGTGNETGPTDTLEDVLRNAPTGRQDDKASFNEEGGVLGDVIGRAVAGSDAEPGEAALGDMIASTLMASDAEDEKVDRGGSEDDDGGGLLSDVTGRGMTGSDAAGGAALGDIIGSTLKEPDPEDQKVDRGAYEGDEGGLLSDVTGRAVTGSDAGGEAALEENIGSELEAPEPEDQKVDRGGSEDDDGEGLLGDVTGRAVTGSDAGGEAALEENIGSELEAPDPEDRKVDRGGSEDDDGEGLLGDVTGRAMTGSDAGGEDGSTEPGEDALGDIIRRTLKASDAEDEKVDRGACQDDDGAGLLGDVTGRSMTGSDAGGGAALGESIGRGLDAPAAEQGADDRGGNEDDEAGDSLGDTTGSGLNAPADERGDDEDPLGDVIGGGLSSSSAPAVGGSDAPAILMGDAPGLGQEADGESEPADQSGGVLADLLGDGAALMGGLGDDDPTGDGVTEDE